MSPAFNPGQRATDAVAGFQALLRRCPTSSDRKRLILAAWECRALGQDETGLLVEAHMLETA